MLHTPPPPKHPLSTYVIISWWRHLLRLLNKVLFIAFGRFSVCWIDRFRAVNRVLAGKPHVRVWSQIWKTRLDKFPCFFCNYSYNSSTIWKQKGITYHNFSHRLPIWTRPRNDGRSPTYLYKLHVPAVIQSLLFHCLRHLSTSQKFPSKLYLICTKILHRITFGEREFETPPTHAFLNLLAPELFF